LFESSTRLSTRWNERMNQLLQSATIVLNALARGRECQE